MSRQTTERLIKAYLDAANIPDNAAIIALMDDDVVFEINQSVRKIGTENLRLLLASKAAHMKEQLADAVIMTSEDGSSGAAEFTWKGTNNVPIDAVPNAFGQRFSMRAVITFEVEDGKFTRISSHRDMQEWQRQISKE
ncbi:MAG: nuclear transport factor 2 family protein [Notoacmeibacter sp.]